MRVCACMCVCVCVCVGVRVRRVQWISRDAYFARVVRKVLHSLTQEYLRKLVESKPALSADFFDRLKQDQVMLDSFFMKYAELAGEQLVTNELSFLQLIQELLQADIDSLPLHFDKIADTWPDKGSNVIDTLAALRSDISRQERKAVLEQYTQHGQQRQSSGKQQQSSKRQQQQQQAQPAAGSSGPAVVDLLAGGDGARSGSSSSSSSSFLNASGFFGVFQSRGKPIKKAKPSTRRGRNRDRDRAGTSRKQEGETLKLEDFLK